MDIDPIVGTPVRIPPGRVAIRLGEQHRLAYRDLYNRYQAMLKDLPIFREGDFDGRAIKVTPKQLEALNRAFAALGTDAPPGAGSGSVFDAQADARARLFKRLQYLS